MESRTPSGALAPTQETAWRTVADPEIVGSMRRSGRRALLDWGLEHIVEAAELCISELVTNAVIHAVTSCPEVEVKLTLLRGCLRIGVTDGDPTGPQRRPPTAENEHGRGLVLVSLMTTAFGVDRSPIGKTVWCVLNAEEPESA